MSQDSNILEAEKLSVILDSLPEPRRLGLLERACLLLVNTQGGTADSLYRWLEDDTHRAWHIELSPGLYRFVGAVGIIPDERTAAGDNA